MPNTKYKIKTGGSEKDLLQYIKPNIDYKITSKTSLYDNLMDEEIQRAKNINSLIKKYNKFKHKKTLTLDEKSQLDNIIKALAEYYIYPERSTVLNTRSRPPSLSPITSPISSPNTSPRRTSSGGTRKVSQKTGKSIKRYIKKQKI
jgi:hypothetical protein